MPSTKIVTQIPLKIVIYTDFQCGACSKLNLEVEPELEARYESTGEAVIEWRLLGALGEESVVAGEATLCARDQGKFKDYMDALFEAWRNGDTEAYEIERLVELARLLGMDQELFRSRLESGVHKAELDRNMSLAVADGVNVVPAMLVGVGRVEGFRDISAYARLIEDALKDQANGSPADTAGH